MAFSSLDSSSTSPSSLRGQTPAFYARKLLQSLGRADTTLLLNDSRCPDFLWAQSGAMWLSGHANGAARPCSAPLAACAQGAWLALASISSGQLDPLFDAYRLLGERAAIAGLSRQGRVSAGGACRLLNTRNGMLALNLAREDDRDLMPAWLEQPVEDDDALIAAIKDGDTGLLVRRARLLGLAAAPVVAPRACHTWYRATPYRQAVATPLKAPVVVDLTSLWAGPLCGQLLSRCGARVIKVESTTRVDGARRGPLDFYQLMNEGKESVALDLSRQVGRNQLRQLLRHADIVLEASRPRGLEQMGIDVEECLKARPGMTWLSITGYGRRAPMRDWIAYGDDAGVAAGLAWSIGNGLTDPVFCADAIADPLTGLHAALLAYSSWLSGGGQLLDISLHDVAAHCISAGCVSSPRDLPTYPAVPAFARTPTVKAAALGADTASVLREFL